MLLAGALNTHVSTALVRTTQRGGGHIVIDDAPAPHYAVAKEIEHFLANWNYLLAHATEEELRGLVCMTGAEPEPRPAMAEDRASPAPEAATVARILGHMDVVKRQFPGVAASPEAFLSSLDSVLIMATLEIIKRSEQNPEGLVEGETAFGQWWREA